MRNASWSYSRQALGPLFQIAESALSVTQLAELSLKWVSLDSTGRQTLEWMRSNGFDAAPLDEPEPYRYVAADWLDANDLPVVRQAQQIDARLLVSADLSLTDGIAQLENHRFYFVLQGGKLQGIVTRADLQRPAVAMVLFSLILATEAGMNSIITRYLGDSWIEQLDERQRSRVEKIHAERVRTNTEVTKLECLMLSDRMNLIGRCEEAVSGLGFSSYDELIDWKKRLLRLRNVLAHGGGILDAQPQPQDAIKLFKEVRSFAERTWKLA